MFKTHPILKYLKYSILAAIVYCITVFIFIKQESFSGSWILYTGNMLFACVIAVFILQYNKTRDQNASAGKMIFAGNITTVMGIIISCIIGLLLIVLLAPEVFSSSVPVLQNTPPQMEEPRHELLLTFLMNAIIGNFCGGAFISLLLPFSVKRDQTGETENK